MKGKLSAHIQQSGDQRRKPEKAQGVCPNRSQEKAAEAVRSTCLSNFATEQSARNGIKEAGRPRRTALSMRHSVTYHDAKPYLLKSKVDYFGDQSRRV